MLYKYLVQFNDGKPDKEVIAECFTPASGNKVYFKNGQKYVGMFNQEVIQNIEQLGEYNPVPEQPEEITEPAPE